MEKKRNKSPSHRLQGTNYPSAPTIVFNLGRWQQKIHRAVAAPQWMAEPSGPCHRDRKAPSDVASEPWREASSLLYIQYTHPTAANSFPPLSPSQFPSTETPECMCNVLQTAFRCSKLTPTHPLKSPVLTSPEVSLPVSGQVRYLEAEGVSTGNPQSRT